MSILFNFACWYRPTAPSSSSRYGITGLHHGVTPRVACSGEVPDVHLKSRNPPPSVTTRTSGLPFGRFVKASTSESRRDHPNRLRPTLKSEAIRPALTYSMAGYLERGLGVIE